MVKEDNEYKEETHFIQIWLNPNKFRALKKNLN